MAAKKQKPPDFTSLKGVLRRAPEAIRHMLAERCEPRFTKVLRVFHESRTGLDGVPYPVSRVTGQQLTLEKRGRNSQYLYFEADGSKLTARLRTAYAPFLVGKYAILPRGRQALPAALRRVVDDEMAKLKAQGFAAGDW